MKNLFILILAIAIASCGNSKKNKESESKKMNIAAAGATFPLPFYNLAFKTYQEKTGNAVTYGGIGSGGGIRSLKDKIVDFGGSDAYLSDAEMQEMPYATVHIPTCMGAVVMAYNLPEGKCRRKLFSCRLLLSRWQTGRMPICYYTLPARTPPLSLVLLPK